MRYNKKKIESAGWGSATFYKNYIELTRKKGVTKMAYYVYGEVRFLSIYDYTELSPQKMKLRTSNRRLNFSLDLVNSKEGVYTSIAKVSSELSSNEDINYDKFSKYEKMLTQRKLSIKFSFYNDTFTESNMPKKTKNSWYKLTDFYENIIF